VDENNTVKFPKTKNSNKLITIIHLHLQVEFSYTPIAMKRKFKVSLKFLAGYIQKSAALLSLISVLIISAGHTYTESRRTWLDAQFFYNTDCLYDNIGTAATIGSIQLNVQATRPRQVVLTYQDCPATNMTITWRTDAELTDPGVFASASSDNLTKIENKVKGTSMEFDRNAPKPPISTRFWINSVQLSNLKPETLYHVSIPHDRQPENFSFRTAPLKSREIIIVNVSDTHIWPIGSSDEDLRQRLSQMAAVENIDFAIVSGDLWYADEQEHTEPPHRQMPVDKLVDQFFDAWHDIMITPDGRRIPMVPAEGNHDGNNDGAPFFYSRLKVPAPYLYNVLEYGPDMVLITLNSGHSALIKGPQTEWLEQTLRKYHDSGRWLLVQMHVPPYPGYRDFNSGLQIRDNWVPLLEKYGTNLVINGHDHTCIRTHPLKNGQINKEEGIVYIINGLDGREPDKSRWYIADAATGTMFWKIRLTESILSAEAVFLNSGNDLRPLIMKKIPH
jgi:acid phosphatase type 7